MSELFNRLSKIDTSGSVNKEQLVQSICNNAVLSGYTITDVDTERPWGAYIRFSDENVSLLIEDFFGNLGSKDTLLKNSIAGLSPKLLIVSPEARLSWQYHLRRSELWSPINGASYYSGMDDNNQGELQTRVPGDIIRLSVLERHRLVGAVGLYSIVAEIWQHEYPNNPSTEDDIVRIEDDYSRKSPIN
ncbi:MAG: phosphoheptose isomerase [Candidatus Saccharibacteria bacterium]